MAEPTIKTTVVGSYPIPDWLAAYPTTPNLIDAAKVILKTQELAGIDVVTDGELSRFDVGHPETNGMIEYFIRPMAGISTEVSREVLAEFRKREGMAFRSTPGGHRKRRDRGRHAEPACRVGDDPAAYRPNPEVYGHLPLHAGQDAPGRALRRPG